MPGKVFETTIYICLVFTGTSHGRLKVVGYNSFGNTAKESQRISRARDEIFTLLTQAGFNVSVLTSVWTET